MSQTAQDYFRKGLQLCEDNRFEAAIDLFDRALGLEHIQDILYNRAKAHFKLKNFSLAIDDFTSLLHREPSNAFYYSERGVAYHLSGDNQKALEDLDKAAALEPQKPFRYSSRAFIKERAGDLEGAIADYEKAIELDPEDAIAYNNKGLIEEKLGHLNTSKQSFAKADQLDPKKQEPAQSKPAALKKAPIVDPPPKSSTIQENDSLTLKSYLGTLKQLFTSGKEQKDFITFVKGLGRKKN